MAVESRVKKSLLNARVNLIFYFLSLILSFFSRKIFLDALGADFIGLNGTLFNLLGFLNLAELGIGSAIGYVLYKPLFDEDKTKLNEIISVFGYLYRWIGSIILVAGCLLACFLPLIFPHTEFSFDLIYFVYFSLLTSSLTGYFLNYKQTLLGADQKNYVVIAYFHTTLIVKSLVQMAIAYHTGNYYFWVAIELSFSIVYPFILNRKISRVYPWLKSEVNQGRKLVKKYPEVMKYTRQMFLHKIGSFAQWQTLPLLIYAFVSLKVVAFYGNYTLITDKLNWLVNSVLGSTEAGVGNLIAEGNKQKIWQVYWEFFTLRSFITGVFSFSLYCLMGPVISLWLGSEYVLGNIILFILVINIFIVQISGTTAQFVYGYGLFHDTWVPIAQLVTCIILSLIGGFYWGLSGILLGNTFSLFIYMFLWKPYFLFHFGFKLPITKYIFPLIKFLLIILIPGIIIAKYAHLFIETNPKSFYDLIVYGLITVGSYISIVIALLLLFESSTKKIILRLYKNM